MNKNYNNKILISSTSFLLVALMLLGGCSTNQESNSNSTSNINSASNSTSIVPDINSNNVSINYYHDTTIKNCAEGLVLIQKSNTFNDNIKKISLKWGDDTTPFEDYDALIIFDNMNASEFEYNFKKNALIPLKATKLWVIAYDNNDEIIDKASKGMAEYKKDSELLYEFQVISDQQVSTGSPCFYRRSKKAFEDIKENSPKSSLIAVNGDIVDEAKAENYDSFFNSFDTVFKDTNQKMTIGLGNHEFIIQSENGYYQGVSEEELNQRYETRLNLWKSKTGNTSQYFYEVINDSYFIYLGTTSIPKALDGNTRADATLGKEQIEWLKNTMEKASKTNKPIYLFSHGSLRDTVSGSLSKLNQTWYGYTLDEENQIRNIIKNYPQTLFFSSHSHWSFESEQSYLISDNYPSFFNTAAIGYLWEGTGGGKHYKDGTYENGGAQGLYLEVYDDQIIIKGREFEDVDQTSKYWFSNYQVVLPL